MTAFFSAFRRLISAASSALIFNSKSGTTLASLAFIARYIFSGFVSAIISFLLSSNALFRINFPKFQAYIKNFGRVRKRANRDVVNSGLSDLAHIGECYIPRGFQLRALAS